MHHAARVLDWPERVKWGEPRRLAYERVGRIGWRIGWGAGGLHGAYGESTRRRESIVCTVALNSREAPPRSARAQTKPVFKLGAAVTPQAHGCCAKPLRSLANNGGREEDEGARASCSAGEAPPWSSVQQPHCTLGSC